MSEFNRRAFLRRSSLGLATIGTSGLVLRADAQPTPTEGDLRDYEQYLDEDGTPHVEPAGEFAPTEYNTPGPFYRSGAPYRGKVCPPLAAGTVLLIAGRVWSHESRRPLADAVLDIWHADHEGRYDNSHGQTPGPRTFTNRIRLVTDETGGYEYETIHPAPYKVGRGFRPSHIHYMVQAPGHQRLTTQLYFKGDPHLAGDSIAEPSLVIDLKDAEGDRGKYERGVFDIVLAGE